MIPSAPAGTPQTRHARHADHTLTDRDFLFAVRDHRCEFDAVTQLVRRGRALSPESAIRAKKAKMDVEQVT